MGRADGLSLQVVRENAPAGGDDQQPAVGLLREHVEDQLVLGPGGDGRPGERERGLDGTCPELMGEDAALSRNHDDPVAKHGNTVTREADYDWASAQDPSILGLRPNRWAGQLVGIADRAVDVVGEYAAVARHDDDAADVNALVVDILQRQDPTVDRVRRDTRAARPGDFARPGYFDRHATAPL